MANSNNRSLALRLKERNTGRGLAFFSGDLEKTGLRRLLKSAAPEAAEAEILVLPHHGAASGMLPAFYDAVQPELAIVSCGFRNAWGFPSAAVRKALDARDVPLISTADCGQITVEWSALDCKPRIATARALE